MPRCPHCRGHDITWRPIAGRAEIFSFTHVLHPFDKSRAHTLPYVVALVIFADAPGIRLITNIVDARLGRIADRPDRRAGIRNRQEWPTGRGLPAGIGEVGARRMTGLMDLPTLWAAVADTARTRPELPCLAVPPRAVREYYPEGLLWSYGEVAERVTRLMERYLRAGYGHGHRVSPGAGKPARIHAAFSGAECAWDAGSCR